MRSGSLGVKMTVGFYDANNTGGPSLASRGYHLCPVFHVEHLYTLGVGVLPFARGSAQQRDATHDSTHRGDRVRRVARRGGARPPGRHRSHARPRRQRHRVPRIARRDGRARRPHRFRSAPRRGGRVRRGRELRREGRRLGPRGRLPRGERRRAAPPVRRDPRPTAAPVRSRQLARRVRGAPPLRHRRNRTAAERSHRRLHAIESRSGADRTPVPPQAEGAGGDPAAGIRVRPARPHRAAATRRPLEGAERDLHRARPVRAEHDLRGQHRGRGGCWPSTRRRRASRARCSTSPTASS